MANLRIIAAIVRKDLAVLWPLAAIVVLLPVLRTDAVLQNLQNDNLRAGTMVVSALAVGLLILGVMHQDASASLRHEWLTRPIPRRTLVAAKLVFIAVIVLVPARVTDFVSTLADGRSIGEALARATSISDPALIATVAVILFATVTSTLLEAAGALIGLVVAVIVVQAVSGSLLPDPKGTLAAGAEWLSFAPAIYLPMVLAGPVLWLQYGRRRTFLARAVVTAACIGAVAPLLMPPAAMFSVLRLLTPITDAADSVGLTLAPGCFPRIATETESGAIPDQADRLWDGDQRGRAGSRAIGFSTTVAPTALPRGWKTMIGYAEAAYVDAGGRSLHRLQVAGGVFGRPEDVDASRSATHFWLASKDAYEDAERRSARLRLTYFVSLLEPVASAEIEVDATRQHLPGFGYCSASRVRSEAVTIDCFARGRRPALVTAAWSDGGGADESLTRPDYMPAALEVLSSASYRLTLPGGSAVPRATLTTYEARAHVEVPVDAPGLLGGPSCSASPEAARTTEGEEP
jgi:hypothetical protein